MVRHPFGIVADLPGRRPRLSCRIEEERLCCFERERFAVLDEGDLPVAGVRVAAGVHEALLLDARDFVPVDQEAGHRLGLEMIEPG